MNKPLLAQDFSLGDQVEILSSRGRVYVRGVVIRTENIGLHSAFVTVAYDNCPLCQDCPHCAVGYGCRTGIHATAFCRKVTS